MSGEMCPSLVRMSLLLSQLQATMLELLACSGPDNYQAQVEPEHEPKGGEDGSAVNSQYLALEEAIRQQQLSKSTAQIQPGQLAVQSPLSTEISLGSSSWRLAMNGWRLVAQEEGCEIRLRPQERSLLLRVAQAPSQFLAPHEVRELNRTLATSPGEVAGACVAGGDAALEEAEAAINRLHTKVIGRLRRRMRMNGHLLPLRASAAGSIYVDEAGGLPRMERRRSGGSKAFHLQRGEKALTTPHPEVWPPSGQA